MAGRLLRRPLLQAPRALRDLALTTREDATVTRLDPTDDTRPRALGRAGVAALVALAAGGWGLAGWQHFVALPRAESTARVAYALDLVDRFDDLPAHRAYVELAADMKPWWTAIEDLQHRIQTATGDDQRDQLIAERDASLVGFVETQKLSGKLELLVASFDMFTRCLTAQVCDEATLERAISIDVKRIWRTFRPWILHRREAGEASRGFGRELEMLYLRFVG